MSRRMMRYVVPAGESVLEITFRGGDSFFVSQSAEGNIYLHIEENDEPDNKLEHGIFKIYESGEAVEGGAYIGSVSDGKVARHVYWVNVWESSKYEPFRGQLRESDDVSEVPTAGSREAGEDAPGSGQDL